MFGKSKDTSFEAETLAQQLQDMQAEKLKLENKLEEAMSTIESFAASKDEHTKQLNNLKAVHETELKLVNDSVNRKVHSALASIGVSAFAIENFTVNSEQSDIEALKKFQSLTGDEKTVYYKNNKEKITRALLKQS